MSYRDFKPGILFAVKWLHKRAGTMNDDRAKAVLNSAAFGLGQARARGECKILPDGYRILGPDELDAVTIERCASAARDRGEQYHEPTQYHYDKREGCYDAATAIRALVPQPEKGG